LSSSKEQDEWDIFVSKVHHHRLKLEGVVYSKGHEIKPEITLIPVKGGVEASISSAHLKHLQQYGDVMLFTTDHVTDLTGSTSELELNDKDLILWTDTTRLILNKTTRLQTFVIPNGASHPLNSYVKLNKPIQNIYSSKAFDKVIYAHKAVGSKITFNPKPSEKFNAPGALVNGVKASQNFSDGEWVGFEEKNVEIELDTREIKNWNLLKFSILNDPVSWILAPKSFEVFGVDDKDNRELLGSVSYQEFWKSKANLEKKVFRPMIVLNEKKHYQKVIIKIKAMGRCPVGHNCVGGKAWTFLDEIVIL
jgi:hypothetical protein